MKKFICIQPLRTDLEAAVYQPQGNPKLDFGKKTCFPIIQVMNGYVKEGEEIGVLIVRQENPKQENRGENEKRFDEELHSLVEEKKFRVKEVKYLDIPYEEGVQTHIDAFRQLIGCIGDDDDLYACLTYGSKTMAITEFITLRYGEAIRSNTMVRCVVYGQKDWSSNTTKMYDVTALLQLAGIVETLAEAKVENAEEIIRRIIAL